MSKWERPKMFGLKHPRRHDALHTSFDTPVKNVSDHVSNMRFVTQLGSLVLEAHCRVAFQTLVQRAGQQEPGRRFGVFLPSAMHSCTSKGFTFCSQGFLTSLPLQYSLSCLEASAMTFPLLLMPTMWDCCCADV